MWNNVVVTINSSNSESKIYVNGTLRDTETPSNSLTTTNYLSIGADGSGCANAANVYVIDEVYLWNRTLNPTEVSSLTTYFYGDVDLSTDIAFTAVDDFNSSSINKFNVSIDWQNGSTTTHLTTNGTINVNNVSDSDLSINVTYFATDYFNLTLYNQVITANTTNNIQASMYQAYVCFDATQKISNASITADNFTISGTTRTECFNISAGTHTVTASKTNWYDANLTFSIAALENTTKTVYNLTSAKLTVYAIDTNSSTYLSNYDLNITSLDYTSWVGEHPAGTTNHSFYLINGTYNLKIDVPGYSLTDSEVNISVTGAGSYTFYLYVNNVVNITYLDETTNSLLTGVNITATMILNDANATIQSTTNGYAWFENLNPGSYEIRYTATDYGERSYFFTLTNRTYNAITLYLLNASTKESITHTLYDEYGNTLSGYIIEQLRYYAEENGYIVVDEGTTNSEGVTVLSAIRNGPYYKFRYKNSAGTELKTSTATQIYDTSMSHYLNLGTSVGTLLNNLISLSYDLSYLYSSDQFKFDFSESGGNSITAEIKLYNISNDKTVLLNSSSLVTSSGTIYISAPEINGTTYKAMAYITFPGETAVLVDTLTVSYDSGVQTFGRTGLWATFMIVVLFSLLGVVNPSVMFLSVPTGVALTRIANLHGLEWTWIIAMYAVGIILLYLTRDKS